MVRKKKTCKGCNTAQFLFSGGKCQKCWSLANPPTFKASKPIKKVADKRKTKNKRYSELRLEYLDKHPFCECGRGCGKLASDIHHTHGREGLYLNATAYWKALSRECHSFIHDNPEEGYKLGLLINKIKKL